MIGGSSGCGLVFYHFDGSVMLTSRSDTYSSRSGGFVLTI